MGLHQRQIGQKSIGVIDWSGKRVLDIGCSDGQLSLEILKKTNAQELVGIDPVPDRIEQAKKLAESSNVKNAIFHVASADNLSIFPDNSFNTIFCNMAFMQFENPQQSLTEMYRVLTTGGEAIINFNIEKSPIWLEHEKIYNQYYGDPNKEIVKTKKTNKKNFHEMADKAGFSEISTPVKDDTYYYKSFEEIMDMMDMSFFTKDKDLDEKQKADFNKILKGRLESTGVDKGIPENWKILFAKLTK